MIAVFVTFESDQLDEERVRKVAVESRPMFEGMPNLRAKLYTLGDSKRTARNVYVWESEDAARAFFTDAFVERVTGRYGLAPTIEFAEILELVDNS